MEVYSQITKFTLERGSLVVRNSISVLACVYSEPD